MNESRAQLAGIILCGGQSVRMGCDKASLALGGESMLARTVRVLSEAAWPIVVVAAAGQELPPVASEIQIRRDRTLGRGPLEGIAVGLEAMGSRAPAAYITGVDFPLLRAEFVSAVGSWLDEQHDIVLPVEGERRHTLAAVYRVSVLPAVERLLSAGERRPSALFRAVRTREVDVAHLRAADPRLDSLINCNRPLDYAVALARLGLES